MQAKSLSGVGGGLVGGLVFGLMMHMMTTPEGEPTMAMVAQVIGAESVLIGWVYHLFNSAVIGAIFGWLFGERATQYPSGSGWGALYGFVWWILGGLILMPMLLGMPPFAPGSLIGHLVYGVVLGLCYVLLLRAGFTTLGQQRTHSASRVRITPVMHIAENLLDASCIRGWVS